MFIVLNLALFKLLPVTLTLPAITGFLISIGTVVDGNILIFERIKEEIRAGKPLKDALSDGFDRAWTAIFTSNLSTIIIAIILAFFGLSTRCEYRYRFRRYTHYRSDTEPVYRRISYSHILVSHCRTRKSANRTE